MVYVALLRGVNVGGRTIVNMALLRNCFNKLGFKSVKTYINSGNVVFETKPIDPRSLETSVQKAIEVTFNFPVTVIVRNYQEFEKIVRSMPKNWKNNTNLKCNVIFLHHSIDKPSILNDLNPKETIEKVIYKPGVLFWSAKTSDLTKSSMVKLSSRPVYKNMTIRNLNTTNKIYEMMTMQAKSL